MSLSKIITPERLCVPLQSSDKTGLITELVDVLDATGGLVDRDAALEAVLKRESERTTGIGYGLAIPHGKSDGCRELVMAAGKPAQPVDQRCNGCRITRRSGSGRADNGPFKPVRGTFTCRRSSDS